MVPVIHNGYKVINILPVVGGFNPSEKIVKLDHLQRWGGTGWPVRRPCNRLLVGGRLLCEIPMKLSTIIEDWHINACRFASRAVFSQACHLALASGCAPSARESTLSSLKTQFAVGLAKVLRESSLRLLDFLVLHFILQVTILSLWLQEGGGPSDLVNGVFRLPFLDLVRVVFQQSCLPGSQKTFGRYTWTNIYA